MIIEFVLNVALYIDGIFYIQTIGLSSVPNLTLRIKILLKT